MIFNQVMRRKVANLRLWKLRASQDMQGGHKTSLPVHFPSPVTPGKARNFQPYRRRRGKNGWRFLRAMRHLPRHALLFQQGLKGVGLFSTGRCLPHPT
jgi:hypothetical protein